MENIFSLLVMQFIRWKKEAVRDGEVFRDLERRLDIYRPIYRSSQATFRRVHVETEEALAVVEGRFVEAVFADKMATVDTEAQPAKILLIG